MLLRRRGNGLTAALELWGFTSGHGYVRRSARYLPPRFDQNSRRSRVQAGHISVLPGETAKPGPNQDNDYLLRFDFRSIEASEYAEVSSPQLAV